MKAIIKRELLAYFNSGIGYIFCAVYLFFAALNFSTVLMQGRSDLFPQIYFAMLNIILLILPVLTMRLFSEERRQKTDQLLLTSPVGVWPLVCGKFFAALTVYAGCTAFTLVYVIVFWFLSPGSMWMVSPGLGLIMGNILGATLFGAAFIAVGMFISSLTESQVVAAIGTFFVATIFIILDVVPLDTANLAFVRAVTSISFVYRYNPFTIGILDLTSVVFFLSICVIFIFLTVRMIERRRWS